MSVTLTTSKPHIDSPHCWCRPEAVATGRRGHVIIAKLQHNDLLGAYFGLFAASRIYDSAQPETA